MLREWHSHYCIASQLSPVFKYVLIICLGVAGTVFPHTNFAQNQTSVLEEILVTARYRQENLQDIPDSITAFTADNIERKRIERINDFAALTPNMRFSDDQEVGVSTLVIRGVRQNRGTGQPPAAFSIDGINATNNQLTTQDLFDVERIEVLRGPQGALYGRNAIGGAVLITTKQPSNQHEFTLRGSMAEGNDLMIGGSASGPIFDDSLLYRFSFRYQDRDGQLENPFLNSQKVDFKESKSVRGKLLFKPSERLNVDLRLQYSDQTAGSGYFKPTSNGFLPLPPPAPPIIFNNPINVIQSNKIGESFVEFLEYSGKIEYEFEWGNFTSITTYTDVDSGNDQDLDQTLFPAIDILVDDESETLSQEFRISSKSDQRARWMMGLFYFDQERSRSLGTTFLGFAVPPAAQELNLENFALFGQLNYDIRENLELTLAFRFDEETPEDVTQDLKKSFKDFQPKASLAYRFSENALGYVTVSRGYRAGGFNNVAPGSAFNRGFDKESLWNYEVGMKSTLFDKRTTANVALFYIDYENQQFFIFDQTGTQANINVPASKIYGAEIEVNTRPIDNLQLNFSAGFIESEIKEYRDIPGVFVPASAIVGKQVPGGPTWSFNAGAQYTYHLSGKSNLIGGIDYEHRGKTYWTLDNLDSQSAYDLVNVRLTLEQDHWSITAFANNLFDEEYQEWFFGARFIGLPADLAWPSKPRQFGVQAKYQF